jgi:hypothetical protein
MSSAHEWCKKDPARFEILRTYVIKDRENWNGWTHPPKDWPFPRYVYKDLVRILSGTPQLLAQPHWFDAALFYYRYTPLHYDSAWHIVGVPWKLATFDKLRPAIAALGYAPWYYALRHCLDLSENTVNEWIAILDDTPSSSRVTFNVFKKLYKLNIQTPAGLEAIQYLPLPALRRIKDIDKCATALAGMPYPTIRFDSFNEAKIAHDEWAEEDRKRILAQNMALEVPFVYTDELTDIVKRHGWYLPKAPIDMLIRGKEHHNCVGSYGKSQRNNTGRLVVFKEDTEAELIFGVYEGFILDGSVYQCKGKYNKDMSQDGLRDIIKDVFGKAEDLLTVY